MCHMYIHDVHVCIWVYITCNKYIYTVYIYRYILYISVCVCVSYVRTYIIMCLVSLVNASWGKDLHVEWTSKPTTIFSYDHPSAHQFWDPGGDATLLHGWGMRSFDPCPNPRPGRSCSPSIGSLADCLSAHGWTSNMDIPWYTLQSNTAIWKIPLNGGLYNVGPPSYVSWFRFTPWIL